MAGSSTTSHADTHKTPHASSPSMTPHPSPQTSNRRRIIADVDTGIDDMLALIYLAGMHHLGEIDLAAVTTSAGNTTAIQAAANTRYVLHLCGLSQIPVVAGSPNPLAIELTTTPETHGPSGLGYAQAPQEFLLADDASAANSAGHTALELWHQFPQSHLLITGPLTLLARDLIAESVRESNLESPAGSALEQFASVTVMGGAVDYPGNTTETAEWNFWVDPDAVAKVFEAYGATDLNHSNHPTRPPLTLASLQVTEQVILTPELLTSWNFHSHHQLRQLVHDAVRFYFEFHESVGVGYCAQIHDLLAAQIACGRAQAIGLSTRETQLAADLNHRGTIQATTRKAHTQNTHAQTTRPAATVYLVDQVDGQKVWQEFARALAAVTSLAV